MDCMSRRTCAATTARRSSGQPSFAVAMLSVLRRRAGWVSIGDRGHSLRSSRSPLPGACVR